MRPGPRLALTLLILLGGLSTGVRSETPIPWPDRNGPLETGEALPEESAGVPTHWNVSTGENISWVTPLEGLGHSTPVVGNGRVWVTSATEDGTQQWIVCLDEQSGEIIEQKLLFENAEPEPLGNAINSYASPTCVLTEDAVFVHFGSYGTVRLDPESREVVWERRDLKCRHFRGPGSSPLLFEDLLILTFDGIDQQYLVALDTESGETVWKTERTTNYHDLDENGLPRADGDYRKAYSTPGVTMVGDVPQLVSVGSRAAFAYNARTGEEIWTITHDDYNAAAPPLFVNGHVLLNTGANRADFLSVRLDETATGNVDESHVVWRRTSGNSDLCSPVLTEGRVYLITNNGIAICIDPATGEEIWKSRIGGSFVSSPIVVNGLIYVTDDNGKTTIFRAGDEYEEVSTNTFPEGMRSSPSVANGALLMRTRSNLYRISETTEE